jgi:MGT family glycosyltransferase
VRVFQTLLAFSGNAPPQLAVTRQLVQRGHEVRVLAHRAARQRIERTGAQFVEFQRALPDLDITRRESDTLRDWEARTRAGAGMRLLKNGLFVWVLNVSRDCTAALGDWPAEVMLFDWMLLGAAVSAEAAGVPAVALVHCPYPLPAEGAPPLFTGLRPMRGPLGALRDRLISRLATRMLAGGLPVLNKARTEHGLQPMDAWQDQLLTVETIYMLSAAELDFSSRAKLPPNVHYVGPAFEPYPHEWSSPWPETNTEPLIVITFSTSYMNQAALAQRVLDAVSRLPVRALLTTGPALDANQLQIPANTRTVAYIPHRTVFPHAALVITHAGWQTINAALADGVPLLCIPDGRDQPDNAARVTLTGAGIRARKNTSPRRLRTLITQALNDPELKRNAQTMATALAESDGALTTTEALERLGDAHRALR